MINAPFPDLRGKHRADPVPPKSDRLVADVDATLKQQVLDLARRRRIPDAQHHYQADDPG